MSGDDGLSNMDAEVDPITGSEQLQTEKEQGISITMEVDQLMSDEQPQTENETDIENQGKKRMRSEQETSSQGPLLQKKKIRCHTGNKNSQSLTTSSGCL